MCYSSTASFAVGLTLAPAGIYCIRESLRFSRSYGGFAVMPLLFGVQQISEGFVWVGMDVGRVAMAKAASMFFLFFALMFWPFWISFSSSRVEMRRGLKSILRVTAVLGALFGGAIYIPIDIDPDHRVAISVVGHSIRYDIETLAMFGSIPAEVWQIFYATLIVVPLLVMRDRHLKFFGVLIAVAFTVSYAIFHSQYVSVWCMFAAVLSAYIAWFIKRVPIHTRN